MPFDFLSSTSSAEDNRIAATDQAQVLRGMNNASATAAGAQAASTKSKILNAGAVDLSGTKGDITTGLKITDNKGSIALGVTGSDLAVITGQFSDTINRLSQSASDVVGSVLSQQSSTLGDALTKVSDLSAGSQSGGQTYTDKTLLYVTLAGFAALVALFYFIRK